MNKEERLQLMSSAPVGKALLKLSTPTVIAMLVMAVYNLADRYFVGLLHDTASYAATQVVMPAFQLIGAFGLMFGMGAASVISRKLGEKDFAEAKRTSSTAFYLALITGIGFSICGFFLVEPIVKLFGATETNLAYSIAYGRIILGGATFQVLNMSMNNMLRAEGAAKQSGIAQLSGALLNIALDPIFIFVFKLGVEGAAYATIISQAFTTAYLLFNFTSSRSILHLNIKDFKPTLGRFSGIMIIGIPTLFRQLLSAISFGIMNNVAKEYGDSALAAIGTVFIIFMLVMMSLFGLSQGLQPLIGYNYGEKNKERVNQSLVTSIKWTIGLSVVFMTISMVFAPGIMKLFMHDNAEAVAIGAKGFRLLCLGLIPFGITVMFGGYFQAVGSGPAALILALSQQGIILIPLTIFMPMIWGLDGLLISQPVAFVLSLILALALYFPVRKKIDKKMDIEPAVV